VKTKIEINVEVEIHHFYPAVAALNYSDGTGYPGHSAEVEFSVYYKGEQTDGKPFNIDITELIPERTYMELYEEVLEQCEEL